MIGRTCLAALFASSASVAWSGPVIPITQAAPPSPVIAVQSPLRHADPALEALLPDTLGGVNLIVESQAGTDLSTNSAPFDAFLAGLGKTRADFTLASAYAQGGGLKAEVGAWRVIGADPALLLSGFRQVVQASSTTPLTIAEETIGGRAGDPDRRPGPAHPRPALRCAPRRHASFRPDARARARRVRPSASCRTRTGEVKARR